MKLTGKGKLALAFALCAAAGLGCQNTTPTLFGYQLGPGALYDENIGSIYVPVFKNREFQTTPYRGIEVDITQAIVREIGARTPFKVISNAERADTELVGVVTAITKNVLNRNQQNTIREGEVVVTVDLVWWDLRNGKILSSPRRGVNQQTGLGPKPPPVEAFDPTLPLPPEVTKIQLPVPVRIVSSGRLLPELGETNASAEQRAINSIAVQVVSMMEKPWGNGGRRRLNPLEGAP